MTLQDNAGKKENYGSKLALDTGHLPHQAEEQAKPNLPVRGIFTLIGGFLLCLSFGSDFSFSNINTYLTSYMRVNGYNDNLREVLLIRTWEIVTILGIYFVMTGDFSCF